MKLLEIISRIEAYVTGQTGEVLPRPGVSKATHRPRPRVSNIGIGAGKVPGRVVARSGSVPFWRMRGYRLVNSNLPGVRAWRGPLVTRYGQVITEIESAHPGQYGIFITNLPTHLHGHPCLPKSRNRWQMHVHGEFHNLDHVIFAAERELEHHWNWKG